MYSYPLWYEPCSKLAVERGPICSVRVFANRWRKPGRSLESKWQLYTVIHISQRNIYFYQENYSTHFCNSLLQWRQEEWGTYMYVQQMQHITRVPDVWHSKKQECMLWITETFDPISSPIGHLITYRQKHNFNIKLEASHWARWISLAR